MIKAEHISFSYGMLTLFDHADFSASRGQLTVIQGESGSGKTTFLDILSLKHGIYYNLFYDGVAIQIHNQDKYIDHLYYMNQNPLFCHDLTVIQQWDLLKEMYSFEGNLDHYILMLGLTDKIYHYPLQLSGGEKLRVALLNAMIIQPDILLIDEPTASLDEEYRNIYLDILSDLKRKSIVIVATHDVLVMDHADDLYEIRDYKLHHTRHLEEIICEKSEKQEKHTVNWFLYFLKMKKHKIIREVSTIVILSFIIAMSSFSVTMENGFLNRYSNLLEESSTSRMLIYKAIDNRYHGYNYLSGSEEGYFPITNTEYQQIKDIKHISQISPKLIFFSDNVRNDDSSATATFKIFKDDEEVFDYTETALSLQNQSHLHTIYIEGLLKDEIEEYLIENFSGYSQGLYVNAAFLEQCGLTENDVRNSFIEMKICVPQYNVSGITSICISDSSSYEGICSNEDYIPTNYIETKTTTLRLPVLGIISDKYLGTLQVDSQNALYTQNDYLIDLVEQYHVNKGYTKYIRWEENENVNVDSLEEADFVFEYTPFQPNTYVVEVDSEEYAKEVFDNLTERGFSVDWTYTHTESYGTAIINTKRMMKSVSLSILALVIIVLGISHFIKGQKESELNQWIRSLGCDRKKDFLRIKFKKYLLNSFIVFGCSVAMLYCTDKAMLYILHNNYFITVTSLIIIGSISFLTQMIMPMLWEVTHLAENHSS